jgi:peroxidase
MIHPGYQIRGLPVLLIIFILKDGSDLDFKAVDCLCNSTSDSCSNIEMPSDETIITAQTCVPFTRSSPTFARLDCDMTKANYREQLNLATSFLDLSQVYGTTKIKSDDLRLLSNGHLRTSPGVKSQKKYLPKIFEKNQTDQCSRTDPEQKCFVAGDSRTSENLGLVAIHTLFMREHNRIATQLATVNPKWNDDKIFNEARRILIGIYQHIIYNEWVCRFNLLQFFSCKFIQKHNLKPSDFFESKQNQTMFTF